MFSKLNFLLISTLIINTFNVTAKQNRNGTVDDATVWSPIKSYTGGSLVYKGAFNGDTLYWKSYWWADSNDAPGIGPDSGEQSAWALINSNSFAKGEEYEWVGWNSDAEKWDFELDEHWDFTKINKGTWGDQIDKKGPGAYLPTYRDGAEGAYTIIHDGFGSSMFEWGIMPGNEVGYDHPRIRAGWGVKADGLDDNEWVEARQMVQDGHEIISHSYNHSTIRDQWKWFFHGDTLKADDPDVPRKLKNIVVDSSDLLAWEEIEIDVPYISYIDGDINKPETLFTLIKCEVADYNYIVDSTFDNDLKIWEYEYNSTGKIRAKHKGWLDAAGSNVLMLKLFCKPAWTDNDYSINMKTSKDIIDQKIYEQVNSPRFPKDKRCEYFLYPYDISTENTHDSLAAYGYVASCGGGHFGEPLPGDFYHPFRLNYDNFYMMESEGKSVFPENPFQRLSLQGLVDRAWQTKGYMIRKFHGCVDVADWNEVFDYDSIYCSGNIPKSLYKSHHEYLDQLIDDHKITVYTPTEAVKYRMTANSVTEVVLNDNGVSSATVQAIAEGCPEEYQDEITVIIKTKTAWGRMRSTYGDGSISRYQPRKMDPEGKAWAISVNPYKQDGKVSLWSPLPISDNGLTNINNGVLLKSIGRESVLISIPKGKYDLEIYDLKGKTVEKQKVLSIGNTKSVKFKKSIANGNYILHISDGVRGVRRKILIK